MSRLAEDLLSGSSSDYDDDDDEPETFTLADSKAKAKGRETALKELEAEEKRQKKEKNRQRDAKLKERAELTRGKKSDGETATLKRKRKAEGSDGSSKRPNTAEDRMLRAMLDAEDEDGLVGLSSDGERDVGEMSAETDEVLDTDDSEDEGFASGDESSDEDTLASISRPVKLKNVDSKQAKELGYLPDHVFKAAFAALDEEKSAPSTSQLTKPEGLKNAQTASGLKKKKRRPAAKEMIVGSKTITTVPQPNAMTAPLMAISKTVPSRPVRRFKDHNLGITLNPNHAKRKGWERRPVTVGNMRSTIGPARNFVRKR